MGSLGLEAAEEAGDIPLQRGQVIQACKSACESAWAACAATGLEVSSGIRDSFSSVAAEGQGIDAAAALL